MANEITIGASLKLANGYLKESKSFSNFKIDQTTAASFGGVQAIGTSHETVTTGDITTPRWAFFRNLDDTNFVEIGLDVSATFYPLAKLLPGEGCLLQIADSVTLYAQADTASVNIEKLIIDE